MPIPNGMRAVSPCTTSIMPSSIPSRSATICANAVSCPWPWLWLPVKMLIPPVGFTRTVAAS